MFTDDDAACLLLPVVPGSMVMDPAGKFLFVADRTTTYRISTPGLYVPGAVSVFAIGSGGSVTEVPGSPFFTSTFSDHAAAVRTRHCRRCADPDGVSADRHQWSAECGVLGRLD